MRLPEGVTTVIGKDEQLTRLSFGRLFSSRMASFGSHNLSIRTGDGWGEMMMIDPRTHWAKEGLA
jgi:hypothetical protein